MYETIDENIEESSYKKGLEYAVRLLAKRDYSKFKLKQKLETKKISSIHIEEVITKLIELKYLNEEQFTLNRIKQLAVKGYANTYIQEKLHQEYLEASEDTIEEVRREYNLGQEASLESLIEKKLRSKTIPKDFENKMKLKNKLISFLSSKGYNYDQIESTLKEYIS